jgi:hypothetical protein
MPSTFLKTPAAETLFGAGGSLFYRHLHLKIRQFALFILHPHKAVND